MKGGIWILVAIVVIAGIAITIKSTQDKAKVAERQAGREESKEERQEKRKRQADLQALMDLGYNTEEAEQILASPEYQQGNITV